ncbi:5'/3'-nucleotidase SurE [Desulfonema magnum]|uniref:5'-nucleotidase SurE n=1 Tax=Desulfonema magnum TaxID=45655 RepID=A0A975GQU9_9BACT|nr:5'/3'-nucleotidase SurE [Desulfonema magnum]QTA90284.1 Nucleoside 5'-monophosphate phosphohydrolase [Desulfonema magnum]
MNIFLTNDDGIYAEGLHALYKRFSQKHTVTVIAPDREQSAESHGITLNEPLRVTKARLCDEYTGYAVNGTPVDCVKLGFKEIAEAKPDMVISGINSGANVGTNINYSGTVAAAREAALYGVTAIAVSMHGYEGNHYKDAALFVETLTDHLAEKGLPFGTCLNVNIPDIAKEKIAGVRIVRQDIALLTEYFEKRLDPRNKAYYWLTGTTRSFEEDADVDGAALFRNYISVTPIQSDLTDYNTLEELKGWNI